MSFPFSKCPRVSRFVTEGGARKWTAGKRTIQAENDLIIFHENADVAYTTDEVVLRARPGSVLFLPSGCSVSAEVLSGESVVVIAFEQCKSEHVSANLTLVTTSAPARLKNRFLHISAELAKPHSVASESAMLTDFYTILYELSRNTADGNRTALQEEKIRPSVAYLERHFTDRKLNIGQVAALSGISETYFRSLFSRQYGCTPLQFVNRKKIERARELLLESDLSISEIEATCGFHDHVYFVKQYQHTFGSSPETLRPKKDTLIK